MNLVNEYCEYYKRASHTPSKAAFEALAYATWCGKYVCKSNFHVLRNNMPGYLMLYTINGSGTIRYNGTESTLSAGSLLIIDCTLLHEYYPNSNGWEFTYLHFNGSFSSAFYTYITKENRFVIVPPQSAAIVQKFDEIISLCDEDLPDSEIQVSDMISHILHLLMIPDCNNLSESSITRDITKACTYIRTNCQKQITVQDVAKLLNLSRGYFSKMFKKQTGKSPYEYILNCRIERAKKLLCETHISVSQIALLCGFEDSSTFIRCFKRVCRKTPYVYRNNYFI